MIIYNATCGTVIAIDAAYAGSFWRRMRGLIGRTDLPTGYGLVFPCCKAIHSFGMRVVLDVLFLDERGQLACAIPELPAWRFGPIVWRSAIVIEPPAGVIARIGAQVGDQVILGATVPTNPAPMAVGRWELAGMMLDTRKREGKWSNRLDDRHGHGQLIRHFHQQRHVADADHRPVREDCHRADSP